MICTSIQIYLHRCTAPYIIRVHIKIIGDGGEGGETIVMYWKIWTTRNLRMTMYTSGVLCKHTHGERASLALIQVDLSCNMPLLYLSFTCYL